jgi:hypothetical protein
VAIEDDAASRAANQLRHRVCEFLMMGAIPGLDESSPLGHRQMLRKGCPSFLT